MDKQEFQVRTALMPLFYRDFRCLAADCRDNCCHYPWEISFTKKDYLKIKRTAKSPEMRAILSDGMSRLRDDAHDGHYAHFNVGSEGGCAFQTGEGLCRLQVECGAEALPEVCRMYPRRCTYTSAAKEFSLSPSCEGVLALLWDLPQGIDFLEEDLPRTDWRTVTVEPPLARFADIRSFCIDVLQERSLSLSRRMLLLGLLIQRLRDQDWTAEGAVDAWLAEGEKLLWAPSTAAALEGIPRSPEDFLSRNLQILVWLYDADLAGQALYRSLFAALSADGEDRLGKELECFSLDAVRYRTLAEQLDILLGHTDSFFENLMVLTAFYLVFPRLSAPVELWRSYAELCMLYSFFRFSAVCSCGEEVSRGRLFRVLGTVSRGLLHNDGRRTRLLGDLLSQSGDTLSGMAILIGG